VISNTQGDIKRSLDLLSGRWKRDEFNIHDVSNARVFYIWSANAQKILHGTIYGGPGNWGFDKWHNFSILGCGVFVGVYCSRRCEILRILWIHILWWFYVSDTSNAMKLTRRIQKCPSVSESGTDNHVTSVSVSFTPSGIGIVCFA
jgi:hypothetical protein